MEQKTPIEGESIESLLNNKHLDLKVMVHFRTQNYNSLVVRSRQARWNLHLAEAAHKLREHNLQVGDTVSIVPHRLEEPVIMGIIANRHDGTGNPVVNVLKKDNKPGTRTRTIFNTDWDHVTLFKRNETKI